MCSVSNPVSRRDLLTCDDASCLTRCHRAFVSNSCHFFRTPLSIPWRQIQSLRDADQAVGRFRHVTGIPDVAHAIVQRRWEMKNPAAQCIWHRRSTPFSSDESVASFLLVVGGCARAGKNCGLSGDRVVGAGACRALTRWWVDWACRLPWPTRCARPNRWRDQGVMQHLVSVGLRAAGTGCQAVRQSTPRPG